MNSRVFYLKLVKAFSNSRVAIFASVIAILLLRNLFLGSQEREVQATADDEVLSLHAKLNMIQNSESVFAEHSPYWNKRKDAELYTRIVQEALSTQDALSALDVGAYESPLLARLTSIPTKVATDQQSRPAVWNHAIGIAFVKGDFLSLQFETGYDVVLCSQVVEHLKDEVLARFFFKMLSLTRNKLIVSTTHELQYGSIDGHIQDPISQAKFESWFQMNGTTWVDGTPLAGGNLRIEFAGGNFKGSYNPKQNIMGVWTRAGGSSLP